MITEDFRFEGFDADAYAKLVGLVGIGGARAASAYGGARLVVVRSHDSGSCAAFVTGRGPVPAPAASTPFELERSCKALGVEHAIVLDEGTVEEITERTAARVRYDAPFADQLLTLLNVARELEDEGKLVFWPRRTRLPIPSEAMLRRAFDLVLPDHHALVIALFAGHKLATGCVITRRLGAFDRMLGPDCLLDLVGPLAGDHRRDHRRILRSVGNALAPVHMGVFAQRETLEALLRSSDPGDWARAVAARELIISPAPGYVHLAVAADALHAAGKQAALALGGLDLSGVLGGYLGPVATAMRGQVAQLRSLTSVLGFNPLEVIRSRLRRSEASGAGPADSESADS
jgi:hypothetical protein